ncbi:acyltransferase [uncultured Roseobacter sp.]|uniref:acyltransferase family protein n=1 Tax=uncultured Roseobacter sp. TaxID=114847 RepID=UPI0026042017|nr:acyltransferase [uncultured Roseobacter sp.]
MNRGLSLWLDVLRVAATLVVVLSHIAYARFTRGDYQFMRDLNLGSDAVIVFFVISGFVIAYAAERDKHLPTYTFNRGTRLLSVLLPALLLTFVFDQMGQRIDPGAYPAGYYGALPLWEMLLRGLSFSNEWGAFERVRLGTNGPLWSLSYEAAYYILFGVAFFLSGARRVIILLGLVVLFGPWVLLLMPAWLMGVWLWRKLAAGGAGLLTSTTARMMAWGAPVLYAVCLWIGVPDMLAHLTAEAMAPARYRHVLAFSDEFIWNALIGVFTTMHIFGMARLLQNQTQDNRAVRWWAGASFSIYVTHYPALHLIDAVFPAETLARDALFVVGSIGIGLIFAQIFERRIAGLRSCIRALIGHWGPSGRRPRPHHP